MSIPDEFVADLKSRVRLSELIGRTVKLKRQGKDWVGLSPFSSEKTPSFRVHDAEGYYKCFSTQKGGDAITWLIETERLTFREAVERLADHLGLEVPDRRLSPSEAHALARRKRALECLARADLLFQARLFWENSKPEAAAREYLTARGFTTNSEISAAGFGWAPAGSAVNHQLNSEGFDTALQHDAGLAVLEGPARPFFRSRLTIPIRDQQGRVIGFGARTLGEDQPKYLNTPGTELFNKGRVLYGADRAPRLMAKGQPLHAVEGYFAQIAMERSGIPAVAPLGTAMSEFQLESLWRLEEAPVICLDGDAAGHRAALRIAYMALPLLRPGRELQFVALPAGKDPDDIYRASGKAGLESALDIRQTLFALVWDDVTGKADLADPDARNAARKRAQDIWKTIKDRETRLSWASAFRMGFARSMGQEDRIAAPVETAAKAEKRQHTTQELRQEAGPAVDLAAVLLAHVLEDPKAALRHEELVGMLPAGRWAPLQDALVEAVAMGDPAGAKARATLAGHGDLLAECLKHKPVWSSIPSQDGTTTVRLVGWERLAKALIARAGK